MNAMRASHTRRIGLVGVLLAGAIGVLQCEPHQGDSTHVADSLSTIGIDSTKAVSLALQAYRAETGAHVLAMVPAQFERDSAGVLIYLRPADPRIQGGGALIRVENSGASVVVRRSQ